MLVFDEIQIKENLRKTLDKKYKHVT